MGLLVGVLVASLVVAAHARAAPVTVAGDSASGERSRSTWAALLLGYLVIGAVATGGAYLLRDNFAGRGLATTVAGWGGVGAGAGLGYGAVRLFGCDQPDCTTAAEIATAVGGLLGGVIGSATGYWLTAESGMSRPYTTAAGLAPAFLFLSVGTIFDW